VSNRAALVAVLVAFMAGLIVSLALRPASREVQLGEAQTGRSVQWRVPTAFGTHLPGLGENAPWVMEQIRGASGGRLVLEVFEPGELMPAFSITDAVREGKVEAGYTWLGYDQGKLPVSVLFGAVPFGLEPWSFSAWWYEGGGEALAREIYAPLGIHILLCGVIGPETAGWFRFRLEGLSDVEGLKIRFAGLGGKVIQRLGASVTMLPAGEIFQALEKGAIDATEYSLPNVDERLGFGRVASFNYFPGWHQPFTAMHLMVGNAAWSSLDPPDQALVETACRAGVTHKLSQTEALQGPVLAGFEAAGIEALTLPDELLAELARVSDEVLAEEAGRDADFARVLASQRAFEESYSIWRHRAYPR
jgi:TRAP-type mannitol/chloroaromatic compound transport system substrate-binding protein